MKPVGIILIVIAMLLPWVWITPIILDGHVFAVFSQYLGVVAIIAMAVALLLTTRMRALEWVFGGLDRLYLWHKWLGLGALAAIVLHDIIGAEIERLGNETWLSELASSLGGNSYDILLWLIVLTVITIVPYRFWRWTHQFIGIVFMLSVAHFIWVIKPFSNTGPLGLYVLGFGLLGTLSYLYTLVPERFGKRRYRYTVTSVEPTGDALAIALAPQAKPLKHQAGQFAFIRFHVSELEEVHPYTISKAPTEDGSLRFTVKNLGDYTGRLPELLKTGSLATIEGPYGHFRLRNHKTPQVWIAAGVGVTPFVAWSQALVDINAPVYLYYCISERANAIHLDELESLAQQHSNLQLIIIDSSVEPRLNLERIRSDVGDAWPDIAVAFCGPEKMRDTLRADCFQHGLPKRCFFYEAFVIRSGIGLTPIVQWLLNKLTHYFPVVKAWWQRAYRRLPSWLR